MITFNRKEQLAILVLAVVLLVGIGVTLVSQMREGGLPDFHVVKGAVPVPEDALDAASAQAPPDTARTPVNVNTASVADLQLLPRIGPTTAQRIVDYRTRNGRFEAPEDLARVRGIGPRTVELLRPLISFGPK